MIIKYILTITYGRDTTSQLLPAHFYVSLWPLIKYFPSVCCGWLWRLMLMRRGKQCYNWQPQTTLRPHLSLQTCFLVVGWVIIGLLEFYLLLSYWSVNSSKHHSWYSYADAHLCTLKDCLTIPSLLRHSSPCSWTKAVFSHLPLDHVTAISNCHHHHPSP